MSALAILRRSRFSRRPPREQDAPSENTEFSFGLKISVGAHVALALAILVKSVVFPGTPTVYVPTLRVDIVGLPDVLKKDLGRIPRTPPAEAEKAQSRKPEELPKPKPAPPVPEKEQAKPEEMVYKPKPGADAAERARKMKNALDRIKALSKIANESTAPQAAPIIKGNAISKGTSLSPDARESATGSYYDQLRDRLQENWALPVWLARQNLSAQVQIFIDARGRLHGLKFVKLSGNAQFDDAVKKTIAASQPFPLPPQDLSSKLLVDGILVGFPL